MIALVLALTLVSPLRTWQAWGDEVLCWPSGYCAPRVVNLGTWDPVPSDYVPEVYKGAPPCEACK